MKIADKISWNNFVYGLLYPGFVGSMIYELMPFTSNETNANHYFSLSTLIKLIITLFYCVDYLHLYSDMHPIVPDEKRTWRYLLSDVGSSVFFFLAFVFVKISLYWVAVIFMALVPVFFSNYTKANKADLCFTLPYSIMSLITGFVFLISFFLVKKAQFYSTDKIFLLWFSLASFIIYCIYVFYYYDKFSKKADSEIYGSQ
jgi:hypothetical protein